MSTDSQSNVVQLDNGDDCAVNTRALVVGQHTVLSFFSVTKLFNVLSDILNLLFALVSFYQTPVICNTLCLSVSCRNSYKSVELPLKT